MAAKGKSSTSLSLDTELLNSLRASLRYNQSMSAAIEDGIRLVLERRDAAVTAGANDAFRNPHDAGPSVLISEQNTPPPSIQTLQSDIFGPLTDEEVEKVKTLLRILRSGREDANRGIIWNLEWAASWLDRQGGDDGSGGSHAPAKPKGAAPKEGGGARKAQKLG